MRFDEIVAIEVTMPPTIPRGFPATASQLLAAQQEVAIYSKVVGSGHLCWKHSLLNHGELTLQVVKRGGIAPNDVQVW